MKISELLAAPNQDPVYYDIDVDTDSKAFLNPLLVSQRSKDIAGMEKATQRIDSFFNYIIQSLTSQQIQNIALVSEENATHLGYSRNKSVGHGPKKDPLLNMLTNLNHNAQYKAIIRMNGNARKLSSLTMFVPDFSFDSISDLTTRIIEKELYSFTISTVNKLGYDRYLNQQKFSLVYWDSKTSRWVKDQVKEGLYINGKFTLLVPKHMVEENRFTHNPDDYIRNIIAPRIINNLPQTGKKPRKKDIIKKAINDAGSAKALVTKDLETYPDDFINYFD
ncbi:hypothetical protein C6Y11_04340 [Lactiplantibacillus pentosus]|uniref:Uncharacterized protein n=1 Tax=Lactiplantibacillus pentosus TaxID=1589 RepID=A0ABX5D2V7_LACPE|nr:hypothetical protein [Lactiplantibacillus pentosus]PRO80979.1 hypothetical protein C6Y11_04340 [Lactiplantibacillus pentosus]PRO93362.1 hypothetical protein C6Y12_02870 [Lactiplantibacillus pentosus]PRO95840.1 hypothetical protein C6Y08_02465 [Lactiplantibacillus pentosus]